MLTAVITLAGDSLVSLQLQTTPPTEPLSTEEAVLAGAEEAAGEEGATETHELDEGPSPITPELKEMAWGAGAFIVLAVVMRFALYPRLRRGMQARYDSIQQGFTDADTLRDSARGEVAAYETALAGVKAEAAAVVDVARQQLESERQARLTEVNGRIAERRSAAAAATEAARQAAAGQVNDAVGTVASRLVAIVTGTQPSADAVRAAVESVANVGVR